MKIVFDTNIWISFLIGKVLSSLKDHISSSVIELLTSGEQIAEIIEQVDDCTDQKDNFILDIAVNGKAEYVVTGDRDLIRMNPFRKIRIVSCKEFEQVVTKAKDSI
ncbi:MAG: putative toxin-antitoxin system toxin component, PIN family [Candidatus Wallbacteria bacterium]|nr:putative toxin-antitoxin system toxin component, PIN family [Candidatus Wallbacteria bacterium]